MATRNIHLLTPVSKGEHKCIEAMCHLYGDTLPLDVWVHRRGDKLIVQRESDPTSDDLYVIWSGLLLGVNEGEVHQIHFSLKIWTLRALNRLGLWSPAGVQKKENTMQEFLGALASTLLLAGVFALGVYGLAGMFGAF